MILLSLRDLIGTRNQRNLLSAKKKKLSYEGVPLQSPSSMHQIVFVVGLCDFILCAFVLTRTSDESLQMQCTYVQKRVNMLIHVVIL